MAADGGRSASISMEGREAGAATAESKISEDGSDSPSAGLGTSSKPLRVASVDN